MSYVVSKDGEVFKGDFATPEEAKNAAPELLGIAEGSTFHIGKVAKWEPFVDGGSFIRDIVEVAREELEEDVVGDWLDSVSPEALEDLDTRLLGAFGAWMQEHGLGREFDVVADITEEKA